MDYIIGEYNRATYDNKYNNILDYLKICLYSRSHDTREFIADELNIKTLALLANNSGKSIEILHKRLNVTTEDISRFNKPYSNFYTECGADINIRIWHTYNGYTKIKQLDEEYEDNKTASLMLQQTPKHVVRFYKTSEKELHIFTSKYDWDIARKIVALIPKLFEELNYPELLPALANLGMGKLAEADSLVSDLYLKAQILDLALTKKLATLKQALTESSLSKVNNQLENAYKTIENYEKNIASTYKTIVELNKEILAIKTAGTEYVDEYIDYLLHHKLITVVNISDEAITLLATTPLRYFDPDVMRKFLEKDLYTFKNDNFIKWLMKKLFIDAEIQLYTQTCFMLYITSYRVYSDSYYEISNYLPHPHLVRYNCWGGNGSQISKALSERDLIGATEQAIAATYNLNLLDNTVLEHFVNSIMNNKYANQKMYKIVGTNEFKSMKELREVYRYETNQTD